MDAPPFEARLSWQSEELWMKRTSVRVLTVCACISLAAIAEVSVQDYAMQSEISDLRRELAKAQADRQRVQREAATDVEEYEAYQERVAKRFASLEAENDSIRTLITEVQLTGDSLEALICQAAGSRHQLELSMEHFRRLLIARCEDVLGIAAAFPPLETEKLRAALQFLQSELAARNVHADEGLNRLVAVIRDLEEITMSIQAVQTRSPVADLSGSVYRIRVGAVFEGIVDEAGTRAALWTGNDGEGKPQWKVTMDKAVTAELLEAAYVRNGKAVPDFVSLPLSFAAVEHEEDAE